MKVYRIVHGMRNVVVIAVVALAIGGGMMASVEEAAASQVVKNPYDSVDWDTVKHYIANFHSHTVYSDGRAEPDQLIYNYAEAGYHILAITDHDNHHTVREEDGERATVPTASTTWPWTNWISERPSQVWHRAGFETSAFYPDLGEEGMLAVRGNELSSHPHLVSLFNDCGYEDRAQTDDERMACIGSHEGLGYWAHPVLYVPGGSWEERFFDTDDWAISIQYYGDYIAENDHMLGFEMQLGDRTPLEVEFLDRLLAAYYRDHDIFYMGSDDTHSTSVSGSATLTIVLAESLTEEAVRSALEQGHKFVGTRVDVFPEINAIIVDDAAQTLTVDAEHHDGVTWFKDGAEYATGDALDYSDMENAVVRFQLAVDGATFYSQAFYIE